VGSSVAEGLAGADGVIYALPVAQFLVELGDLERAGGDLIRFLRVSTVGAFDVAIELGRARRQNEQARRLAGCWQACSKRAESLLPEDDWTRGRDPEFDDGNLLGLGQLGRQASRTAAPGHGPGGSRSPRRADRLAGRRLHRNHTPKRAPCFRPRADDPKVPVTLRRTAITPVCIKVPCERIYWSTFRIWRDFMQMRGSRRCPGATQEEADPVLFPYFGWFALPYFQLRRRVLGLKLREKKIPCSNSAHLPRRWSKKFHPA